MMLPLKMSTDEHFNIIRNKHTNARTNYFQSEILSLFQYDTT